MSELEWITPPTDDKELAPKPSRRRSYRFAAATAAGAGALGLAFTGGMLAKGETTSPDKVAEIAQHAVLVDRLAQQQAQSLTEQLKVKDGKPVLDVHVLNGTVYNIVNGQEVPIYQDLILLTVMDEDKPQDAQGKFLSNGRIGVQSFGTDGHVQINAVPYWADTMRFEANDPQNVVLNLGVYESQGNGLIGYDMAGEQTYSNLDGTAITPGRPIVKQ